MDEVKELLQRYPVQSHFLSKNGGQVLEYWLRALPDKRYPNISFCKELLTCIDGLQVQAINLDGN